MKFSYLLSIFILMLMSCSTDSDNENDRIEGTMSFTINGINVDLSDAHMDGFYNLDESCRYDNVIRAGSWSEPGYFLIVGYDRSLYEGGTQDLQSADIRLTDGDVYSLSGYCPENGNSFDNFGTLSISSHSNGVFRGTFNFTASMYEVFCEDGEIIKLEVSNGTFEINEMFNGCGASD